MGEKLFSTVFSLLRYINGYLLLAKSVGDFPVMYKHCIQGEVVNVVLLVTSCYRNSVKVWLYASCNPKVQLYLTTFEPNGSLCLHLCMGCQYKVTRSVTIPPYIVC